MTVWRHTGALLALLVVACSVREPVSIQQRRVLIDAGRAPSCGPVGGALVGAPCECASDCAAGATCLDEPASGAPGGLCFRSCELGDDSCGPSAICRLPPDSGGVRGCAPRCVSSAECTRGWHCLEGACTPRCVEHGDCTVAGHVCDRSTGDCVAVRRAGRDTFERCVDFAECRSGICNTEGRCATVCVLGVDSCPSPETCVWVTPGDEPFGICAPRCLRDEDCGEGLACVLRGRPGVTERVCYPGPRGGER